MDNFNIGKDDVAERILNYVIDEHNAASIQVHKEHNRQQLYWTGRFSLAREILKKFGYCGIE